VSIGFIGTGSMGNILISSFIRSGAVNANEIIASNRTRGNSDALRNRFPGLIAANNNIETVQQSNITFICVKPLEFKQVIEQIRPYVKREQIIVSITSPVLIAHLEEQLPCKIAKVIPSITNQVCSGASLCMYGSRMEAEDRKLLDQLLRSISTPLSIDEQFARVTSDISSCGPAFLCFFVQKLIDASVEETGICREEATKIAAEMVLGTGRLLTSGEYTPETLQHSVCVPGGVTAEGIRLMTSELEGMFNKLIQTTHTKYEDDLEKVDALLYGSSVDSKS